jgi:hypothetical protein
MAVHSKETIDLICSLRKEGLSCEKIAKRVCLTKNQVLALVYKHYLKIDRHRVYRDKTNGRVDTLADRELRPSVPFVIGLNDSRFYVVHNRPQGPRRNHASE